MVEKGSQSSNQEKSQKYDPSSWRESQLMFDSPDLNFASPTLYGSGLKIFSAYDDFLRTYGARMLREAAGPGNPLSMSTASFEYTVGYFPLNNGRILQMGRAYHGDPKYTLKFPQEEVVVKIDDEKKEADIAFVRSEPLAARMNHYLSLVVADEFLMDMTDTRNSIVFSQDLQQNLNPKVRKNSPKSDRIFIDGNKLFALRQLYGLTNKDIQDLMEHRGSKISNAFLSLLERGIEDMMHKELAENIAGIFGCNIDAFKKTSFY